MLLYRLPAQVLRLLSVVDTRQLCLRSSRKTWVSELVISKERYVQESECLTMPMPELRHPHTSRHVHSIDVMSTVLLRRVFVLRINIGNVPLPGSEMPSKRL